MQNTTTLDPSGLAALEDAPSPLLSHANPCVRRVSAIPLVTARGRFASLPTRIPFCILEGDLRQSFASLRLRRSLLSPLAFPRFRIPHLAFRVLRAAIFPNPFDKIHLTINLQATNTEAEVMDELANSHRASVF